MKFQTEVGTDIAMIGIWDADVGNAEIPFRKMMEELSEDGRNGKMLRVDTGADGEYSLCVVSTPEDLESFQLEAYSKAKHDFFLSSKSGKFIAGGIEDYRNGSSRGNSENNKFLIFPGAFRIHVYVNNGDEELIIKQVAAEVGDEDWKYYENYKSGCGIAFGFIVVGMILGFFWTWWALVACILLAFGVMAYFSRLRSSDERIQNVERAFRNYEKSHPAMIFHFEAVQEMGVSRGFFHMDELADHKG